MTFVEARKYLEKHCFCIVKKKGSEWEMKFEYSDDDECECYNCIIEAEDKQDVIDIAIAIEEIDKEFVEL